MHVARLIAVFCLFFALNACETVCEEYDYTPKPDGDILVPDGDIEFIPQDGDQPSDGDVPSDGDTSPDGDIEGDGDLDADTDETEAEAEEDVEAEAEILPFSGYLPIESTEYGLWRYDFTDVSGDSAAGIASLWEEFSDETPRFATESESVFSNPPSDVVYRKIGTVLWSAYVPAAISTPKPDSGHYFLRRMHNYSNSIDVAYYDIEAPDIQDAQLTQAGLLPTATTENTVAMVMLAYKQVVSDTDAFLIVQSHRVVTSGNSATPTPMTVPLYQRLADGIMPDASIRILHDGFATWVNAGGSLHKYIADGTFDSSYRINYQETDLERANIIDMDLMPDQAEMVMLHHLVYDNGEERILWTVHQRSNPVTILDSAWLPLAGPPWRTAMSEDGKYALALNPDPADGQTVYIMNLKLGGHPVRSVALPSWGRPIIRSTPDRFLRVLPVTWDNGATVDLQVEEMDLDEMWQNALPLKMR